MTFKIGDSVIVTWHGVEHLGAVDQCGHGQFLCRIRIDPDNDYTGSAPPPEALDPEQIVWVREKDVRHA